MTMITPSYLGETIEYSSLHACRSTLEDPSPARRETHPLGAGYLGLLKFVLTVQRQRRAQPSESE